MSDLLQLITAALEERESKAKAADVKQGDPDWWVSEVAITGGEHFTVRSRRDSRPIARVQRLDGDNDEPAAILDGAAVAAHIAANDPSSVLLWVGAMRGVLERHESDGVPPAACRWCYAGQNNDTGAREGLPWPCPEVLSVAEALGVTP